MPADRGMTLGSEEFFKISRMAEGLRLFTRSENWYSMFRSTHFLVSRLRQQKKPLPALFSRTGDRTCLRCHPRLAKGALLPTFTLLNAEHVGPTAQRGWGPPCGAIAACPPPPLQRRRLSGEGWGLLLLPLCRFLDIGLIILPRGEMSTPYKVNVNRVEQILPRRKCQREKRKGASYHNVLS